MLYRKAMALVLGLVMLGSVLTVGGATPARASGNCPGGAQFGGFCVSAQAFGIYGNGDNQCGGPFSYPENVSDGGPGRTFASAVSLTQPPQSGCSDGAGYVPPSASADLSTGQLKAYADSFGGVGTGADGADANFQDTVTLSPPANYAGTSIHVALSLAVDASVVGSSSPFFPTYVQATLLAQINPYTSAVGYYCDTSSSGFVCPPNSASPTITLSFDVPINNPTFTLNGELVAHAAVSCDPSPSCTGPSVADAGHTGQLGLSLPSGVRFSSASSALLANAPHQDSTPPVITPSVMPAPNAAGWNDSVPVVVSWAVSDPESGISSSTGCDPTNLSSQTAGTSLTCSATDGANLSSTQSVTVRIDTTAPVTTAGLSTPPNANGWNSTAVTVALTAHDTLSGVVGTEFNLDGAGWQSYTGPVALTTDGIHTLQYRSEDKAGNVETAKSLTVRLDTTPPSCTAPASPSRLWPPNHKLVPVGVTVTTADATSGVAGYSLSALATNEGSIADEMTGFVIGGSGTAATTGSLLADRNGSGAGRVYTFTYLVTDRAGNSATCGTVVAVPHDQGR